jgi:hypothetical protein
MALRSKYTPQRTAAARVDRMKAESEPFRRMGTAEHDESDATSRRGTHKRTKREF